jgi:hypothetical protein
MLVSKFLVQDLNVEIHHLLFEISLQEHWSVETLEEGNMLYRKSGEPEFSLYSASNYFIHFL